VGDVARAAECRIDADEQHAERDGAYADEREASCAQTRTGGAERNEAYLSAHVDSTGADPSDLALALDPQTSGGLLLAVPPDVLADYLSAIPEAIEIGVVEAAGDKQIRLG